MITLITLTTWLFLGLFTIELITGNWMKSESNKHVIRTFIKFSHQTCQSSKVPNSPLKLKVTLSPLVLMYYNFVRFYFRLISRLVQWLSVSHGTHLEPSTRMTILEEVMEPLWDSLQKAPMVPMLYVTFLTFLIFILILILFLSFIGSWYYAKYVERN
jgi:hypothetical protein